MADPQHQPNLDAHDRLTVRLYRLGLGIGAVGVLVQSAWALWLHQWVSMEAERSIRMIAMIAACGAALTVANLHLYDKRVRWIIGGSGVLGLWLMAMAGGVEEGPLEHLLFVGGQGFVFVVLSALALKEQFCFRIPGLKLVPLFLAVSIIPALIGNVWLQGLFLIPAGLLLLVLVVAKVRMPLGHDVGDKSSYQV